MKRTVPGIIAVLVAMPLIFSAGTVTAALQAKKASAGKSSVTLTVLNPQGFVKKSRELAPRLETLKGKKVALWLSATRDQVYAGKGAELYDLLEKMLKEEFVGIHVVPYMALPMKFMPENEVVAAIVKAKPDAVVAAFGG
jgi:ABC-type nitrate/sulfonate/bicarbonate transport system substrate-binding protein